MPLPIHGSVPRSSRAKSGADRRDLGATGPLRREWPFVGRRGELAALRDLLNDPTRSGAVLVGAAGVGKTRLASETLGLAEALGYVPISAQATKTAKAIPFGAVATLLPPSVVSRTAGDRAEMIREIARSFIDAYAPRRVAFFIDDAHLLDDATATLIHQLANSGSIFVLLTVRSTESVPDAVVSLWKDAPVDRMVIGSLSAKAAEEMLTAALGAAIDSGTLRRLVSHTGGNTMWLRELVLGAVEDGSLRNEQGLWRQAGAFWPSDRLVELVETRLAALSAPQRSLMELLAFGEPIGRRELESLADRDAAEVLERQGLLSSELSGRRLQVRLAHPLYADVLRATTPAVRTVTINRALAEAVEQTGARRREDSLRIATWRLTCGGASPRTMLDAAHAARWSYDFDLAHRLARAAVDAGAGFPAKLLAVQISALRGHGAEVDAELDRLDREAATDDEHGAVAVTRLDLVAFSLARIDQALEFAERAEQLISDPGWKDEIRARRASLLLVVGSRGPGAAVEVAGPLLDRAHGSAKVWASFTTSCSLTRLGRMREALRWADVGETEHLTMTHSLAWPPWIHVYARGEALAQLGRLDEAEAMAMEQYEHGIAEGSTERQAFFAWQLATRVGERGDVRAAIQRCREARALYDQLGRPFFVHHCLVHLALALAMSGKYDAAQATLAEIDDMDLPPGLFAYSGDLFQARAWTASARGELRRARELLREGLAFGERTGDLIGQATALHGLARLGEARQVAERLTEVVVGIDGELHKARAAHAQALATADPEALRAVSIKFESMGANVLAMEAAAGEAEICFERNDRLKATAAERRARSLARRCGGISTPTLDRLCGTVPLTEAELRVAHLAAVGSSNREIAEEFHLSVRTVEHQLQSAYSKLGINRRADLAGALSESGGEAARS